MQIDYMHRGIVEDVRQELNSLIIDEDLRVRVDAICKAATQHWTKRPQHKHKFGLLLADLRIDCDLSQMQLAEIIKVSRA